MSLKFLSRNFKLRGKIVFSGLFNIYRSCDQIISKFQIIYVTFWAKVLANLTVKQIYSECLTKSDGLCPRTVKTCPGMFCFSNTFGF